jgi:hypothetical protein
MYSTGRVPKRIGTVALFQIFGTALVAVAEWLGNSKGWKDEVRLQDGHVLLIERFFRLG